MATAIRYSGLAGHSAHRDALFGRIVETIALWQKRAGGRRQLAALDDHMLSDIGLTRADIEKEIRKPFWRA